MLLVLLMKNTRPTPCSPKEVREMADANVEAAKVTLAIQRMATRVERVSADFRRRVSR